MTSPRSGFVCALAILIGITTFLRVSIALRPEPYTLYSTWSWDACRFGPSSCVPAFHPVPDGSVRLLACSSTGWCLPMTYTYWSDENCNRLTACPRFKPHRARDERVARRGDP